MEFSQKKNLEKTSFLKRSKRFRRDGRRSLIRTVIICYNYVHSFVGYNKKFVENLRVNNFAPPQMHFAILHHNESLISVKILNSIILLLFQISRTRDVVNVEL